MNHDFSVSYSEPINICNDAVFKAIFTQPSAESRTALKCLLSAYLERELSVIDVTTNEPPISNLRDRRIRLDISVIFDDGNLANIEMTVSPREYEGLRFEYYTARLYIDQNIHGQDKTYDDLKPTYHLSFLLENLYPDKEWLHRFVYFDPERMIKMGGRTEIMTVELKKLDGIKDKFVDRINIRERWALFMMNYPEEKRKELIQELIASDAGIAAADKVIRGFTKTQLENLEQISRDKAEWDRREELADMRRKARREGLAEGHAEGLAEGYAEGHTEASIEVAKKLKTMGIPLSQISEATGITTEDLDKV